MLELYFLASSQGLKIRNLVLHSTGMDLNPQLISYTLVGNQEINQEEVDILMLEVNEEEVDLGEAEVAEAGLEAIV